MTLELSLSLKLLEYSQPDKAEVNLCLKINICYLPLPDKQKTLVLEPRFPPVCSEQ